MSKVENEDQTLQPCVETTRSGSRRRRSGTSAIVATVLSRLMTSPLNSPITYYECAHHRACTRMRCRGVLRQKPEDLPVALINLGGSSEPCRTPPPPPPPCVRAWKCLQTVKKSMKEFQYFQISVTSLT